MERIKKMKYVLPVLAVGCLCTLTSVGATRVSITEIPALQTLGKKRAAISTNTQSYKTRFYEDGKINTMKIYLSDSTGNYSIAPTLFPTEGESEKSADYTRYAGKGTELLIHYQDYRLNMASYSCNGYVDIN